jgi:hypothetical protein
MYLTRVVNATGFAPPPRNIEGRRPSRACHKKKSQKKKSQGHKKEHFLNA